ncbi:MAG: thiamine-phosphate kinase [Polyangiaceae bacterium]|nr:thiamine-phosphate kinase [Polyangiaceae bacterium]
MSHRSSEAARIDLIRSTFATGNADRTLVGIGDDAAVLAPSKTPLVWTIDAQVEGVHFRRDFVSMVDVGYRATMAAASDLGAMGAAPIGILAALVLPADFSDDDLRGILQGQSEAAGELGMPIVGGNLARGSEVSITTTVLGESSRPLTRAGACPGDTVVLAGPLGLSAAGLLLLQASVGKTNARPDAHPDAEPALRAYRRPVARIADGLAARDVATAAIDVSDGLARDVGHLVRGSGVRIALDPTKLVTPELERAARIVGADPLQLALHGGEDFALVMTVPAGQVPPGFIPIGRVLPSEKTDSDLVLDGPGAAFVPVEQRGYDHFR